VRAAETITTSLGVEKDYKTNEQQKGRVDERAHHDRAKRYACGGGEPSAEGNVPNLKHGLGFIGVSCLHVQEFWGVYIVRMVRCF
jgi:hypothetical protein